MNGLLRATAGIFSLLLSALCMAGIEDRLNSWFDEMNYSNATDPGIYTAQSARYLTLGGISARAPVTQPFTFVNIQMPKMSAGCSGIDIFAGGFSAIDADQFIANLRNIGQNAQSLAFVLAIQLVSPVLSGKMQQIQDWANEHLSMNVDSCEAATRLVGGTMEHFGAQLANCTVRRMNDYGQDWTTANNICKKEEGVQETEASGSSPNEITFSKGNLAWSILMQDPFFQSDLEFAQLLLNLTGTFITYDLPNGELKERRIPSALSDTVNTERFKNIYTALLLGDKAADGLLIYRCQGAVTADPNSCLTMSASLQKTEPSWVGLHSKIDSLMASIVQKIREDGSNNTSGLNAEELGLINSTSMPLYRYLTATTAYFPKYFNASRLTSNYTALIAEDILLRGLSAAIERMYQGSQNMPRGISSSKSVQTFQEDIKSVLSGLGSLQKENKVNLDQQMVMLQRIQLYEKALMSRLGSGLVASAMWSR